MCIPEHENIADLANRVQAAITTRYLSGKTVYMSGKFRDLTITDLDKDQVCLTIPCQELKREGLS